ncbi:hypothetical protein DL765_002799 [Monosporascus sp. GIB2]|nr:hypothetical protein DL765_002799 [Monosporascus sp. GIB2]
MHEACLRHIQDTVPNWRSIFAEVERAEQQEKQQENPPSKEVYAVHETSATNQAGDHSVTAAATTANTSTAATTSEDMLRPRSSAGSHHAREADSGSWGNDQSRRSPRAAWINPVSEVAPQDRQRASTMNRDSPSTEGIAQALGYMNGNEWTARGNPFSGPPRYANKIEEAEQNAFLSSLGDELDAAATVTLGEVHEDDYEGSTGDTPPFSDGDTCEDKDCDPELQYVLWLSLQANQDSAQTAPKAGEKRGRESPEAGKAG